MARPRNKETEKIIEKCASELFVYEGYEKTSYTKIAEKSGLTKTLVQYYYPKKSELALSIFQRVLDQILEKSKKENLLTNNKYENLLMIGCVYFDILLKQAKKFTLDIIGSRELTSEILGFDIEWGTKYLLGTEDAISTEIRYVLIRSMGGFYELLYYCLKNDKDLDVFQHLRKVVLDFRDVIGDKNHDIRAKFWITEQPLHVLEEKIDV